MLLTVGGWPTDDRIPKTGRGLAATEGSTQTKQQDPGVIRECKGGIRASGWMTRKKKARHWRNEGQSDGEEYPLGDREQDSLGSPGTHAILIFWLDAGGLA